MRINWKRILILIVFLASVVLIGYLLYFFFLQPIVPITTTNTNIPPGDGVLPPVGVNTNIPVSVNGGILPTGINSNIPGPPADLTATTLVASAVASGGLTDIKPLTTVRSYGATLGNDGSSILYYDKNSGQFFRMRADGSQSPLTDKIFHQVETITWSPSKEKAILEYPDGANIIYDFVTKEQFTLPPHWKDFDFSPNSNELVFKSIGLDPENRWLAIAKTDGSGAKQIEALGDKDATVYPAWSPNEQIIATFSESKDFDRQELYFVGLNNENFKSTTIEGRDFRGLWSPDGDRLFYSVYDSQSDFKPTVWIVSAQGETIGQNRRSLGLQTWADKCTFTNNDTIYCAVPQSLPEGAGIFAQDLDNSPSNIYKIDLTSGFRTMVAVPESNHNFESLTVSQDGQYLYFVSKTDGRLYQIRLK